MKEKIIEKQDEIIANLKEVGQLYFRIKDKATKQDVARMASLTIKGRTLESELIILKAQDISVETTINQEVEKRMAEVLPTKNEIGNACQLFDKQKRPLWKEAIWRAGANWVVDLIRSRLSQKTEGGEG